MNAKKPAMKKTGLLFNMIFFVKLFELYFCDQNPSSIV